MCSLVVVVFTVLGGIVFGRWIISSYTVLMSVLAVDQGYQRGPAQGSGHITPFKKNALSGKLVQMGRLDLRVAHESVIGPGLIIGNDIEHIGRFLSG